MQNHFQCFCSFFFWTGNFSWPVFFSPSGPAIVGQTNPRTGKVPVQTRRENDCPLCTPEITVPFMCHQIYKYFDGSQGWFVWALSELKMINGFFVVKVSITGRGLTVLKTVESWQWQCSVMRWCWRRSLERWDCTAEDCPRLNCTYTKSINIWMVHKGGLSDLSFRIRNAAWKQARMMRWTTKSR